MQASLRYIKTKAPPAVIPNQPLLSTFTEHEASQTAAQPVLPASQSVPPATPPAPSGPAPQGEFERDIGELSRDLLLKEQQIEVLIANLPGLHANEEEQVERMKALEREIESLEGERLQAVKDKEELVRKIEDKIAQVGGQR